MVCGARPECHNSWRRGGSWQDRSRVRFVCGELLLTKFHAPHLLLVRLPHGSGGVIVAFLPRFLLRLPRDEVLEGLTF